MDPSIDTIRCPYSKGARFEDNPHIHEPFRPVGKKIYNDVLDAIGNTPMVKINRVGKMEGVDCELLAKCQFMNMGGSIKDRIGKRMVLDAEKRGLLRPGSKIVEATSGNTGIGLTLASTVQGYECIITMPDKMSAEKANVMKALGATIIRTPNDVPSEHPDSHISIARRMQENGEAVLLDQYKNPSNPIAHYDQLAEEILYQCEGKIDAVVMGTGTGGTLTGVSRKLKEKSPNTLIVGIDPHGSILAMPQSLNQGKHPLNKVEGIGYDFVPRTCERVNVHHWVKTNDPETFEYARKLIKKEGLFVGGSAGSVMAGALKFIKEQGWQNDKTKRIVCIFNDSIRNYMTKFLSTQWCIQNGFIPYDELKDKNHPFNDISLEKLQLPEVKAYEQLTVGEAKGLFEKGQKIIPLKRDGKIYAAILPKKFLQLVSLKKLKLADSAKKAKIDDFVIVPHTLDVAQLSKILERHDSVIVSTTDKDDNICKLQVATVFDTFKLMK